MKNWFTGAGERYSFEEVLEIIENHNNNNGSVSVGTDSFIKQEDCVFSTAICLYGADEQVGGRYFVKRVVFKRKKYDTLLQRILAEVQKSVELGVKLLEFNPVLDIEIHLDISDSSKGQGTSRFADMLIGYAKGA
ncbi:MAG TPA: hypothetical protein DEG69_23030, partial [Flavobacteriaceae bacterium]|nr:hypothetical protein [Flavobacteriaceae bacterium]